MPVSYKRLETSKRRLEIRWDHPTPTSEEVLDYRSALVEIRGKDRRPLLVLRECEGCKGTDRALWAKGGSEKTKLLTRWFHCVKLTKNVMDTDHPFHSLFDGKYPPHLFLSSWDGTQKYPLYGGHSQRTLWATMYKVLSIDYTKNPRTAVTKWLRMLNRFDYLDGKKDILEQQLDSAIEQKGPKSSKVRSIRRKMDKLSRQVKSLLLQEKRIRDLGLRRPAREGGRLLEDLRKGKTDKVK